MSLIVECRGIKPKIHHTVFIAPNATIVGDVEIGEKCSIWFGVTIRGDVHQIRIGNETNIQDMTLIHCTYKKCGTTIGNRVSIGHNVILHGCEIGDGTLIGMGAVIMDKAKIGANCLIGAGSLVTENSEIPAGWLAFGRPAKPVRPLTQDELSNLQASADRYIFYQTWYNPADFYPMNERGE